MPPPSTGGATACTAVSVRAVQIDPRRLARAVPWDAEHIAHSAGVCVELGADAIKAISPPDLADLAQVVEHCDAPLFVLGPKMEREDAAVRHARDVVAAGAAGIAFGRNTWGAKDPTAVVRRRYEAVHGHRRGR